MKQNVPVKSVHHICVVPVMVQERVADGTTCSKCKGSGEINPTKEEELEDYWSNKYQEYKDSLLGVK